MLMEGTSYFSIVVSFNDGQGEDKGIGDMPMYSKCKTQKGSLINPFVRFGFLIGCRDTQAQNENVRRRASMVCT